MVAEDDTGSTDGLKFLQGGVEGEVQVWIPITVQVRMGEGVTEGAGLVTG